MPRAGPDPAGTPSAHGAGSEILLRAASTLCRLTTCQRASHASPDRRSRCWGHCCRPAVSSFRAPRSPEPRSSLPVRFYPILFRLERAGWLESRWEDGDPKALGRPRRRLYQVTALGARKRQSGGQRSRARVREDRVGLIWGVVLSILGLVAPILIPATARLVADDAKEWLSWITSRLIERAVSRLPESERERYEQEWWGHVNEWPGQLGQDLRGIWLPARVKVHRRPCPVRPRRPRSAYRRRHGV